MFRVLIGILIVALSLPSPAGTLATERYYRGLRERGLFRLAEVVLLRRLAEKDLPRPVEATLTAELAQTFAGHALLTQGDERTDLWQRAQRRLADFLAAHEKFAKRDLFLLLEGKLLFEKGRGQRWQAELHPAQPEKTVTALATLAQAITKLESVAPILARDFDLERRQPILGEPSLSEAELHRLLRTARRLLGKAYLERARLTRDGQRAATLESAERWFHKALELGGGIEARWPALIGLAEAARLVGNAKETHFRLAKIDTAGAPTAAQDAVARVMAELMIDAGTPDRAVTFLIDYRQKRGSLTGRLRMLQLRGLAESAAILEEQGESDAAEELRNEIATIVSWMEAEHGGYWGWRARLAARRADRTASLGLDQIEALQAARSAQAAGHPLQAAGQFAKAADKANDPLEAAGFRLSQGRMLLQAGHYQEAARILERIAKKTPQFDHAATAHLLSARALGLWHDLAPSEQRRQEYLARLREHRRLFPDSETAAWAALRLARVQELRRQYTETLPILRQVVDAPKYGPAARAAISRNYEHILDYLETTIRQAPSREMATIRRRQHREWAAKAREELLKLTASMRSADDETLGQFQAELALRLAGILLKDARSAAAAQVLVDRLVQAVHRPHKKDEATFWQRLRPAVRPLAVISLAGRGESIAARTHLDAMRNAPIGDLVRVYRGLLHNRPDDLGLSVSNENDLGQAGLSAVALGMLERRTPELPASQRTDLALRLARIEVTEGAPRRAIDRLAHLLKEYPDESALRVTAAKLLSLSNDQAALAQAQSYWRQIARLRPQGGEEWLRARLRVIETSVALGEMDEARKLLTITQLVHPDLGGGRLQQRYTAIAAELDGESSSSQQRNPSRKRSAARSETSRQE